MSVFDTLRIAASGLTAQRLRMDVAASNLANSETTSTPEGGPYQQESVFFSTYQVAAGDPAAKGVVATAIVTPNQATRSEYDPRDPAADANGFVQFPDIDLASQMADLMGASRSYNLDATAAQAAKQSALDALDIGRG
jgi:flagellar basal-body rod protein FlgC